MSTTLVSLTTPNIDNFRGLYPEVEVAIMLTRLKKFTTSNNSSYLYQVKLCLSSQESSVNTNVVTVYLYTDNSNSPGSDTGATFSDPNAIIPSSPTNTGITFTNQNNYLLQPNTSYWIVVIGPTSVNWHSDNTEQLTLGIEVNGGGGNGGGGSFAGNFFFGSIDVDQDVYLYDQEPSIVEAFPDTHYKVIVNVNFRDLLQPEGNFVQEAGNSENVDINLNFDCNVDLLKVYLGYSAVYNGGAVVTNSVRQLTNGGVSEGRKGLTLGVEQSNNGNLGFRFLEVAALQIFGHAQARAAIRNDTQFTESMQDAVDNINTLVDGYAESEDAKHDIFNLYVRQNLITNEDDVTTIVDFNFDAFNFAGFLGAVRINFNMPQILDSAGTEADRTILGINADPKVNILVLLQHDNSL